MASVPPETSHAEHVANDKDGDEARGSSTLRGLNSELRAMQQCAKTLDALEPLERERALDWLASRHHGAAGSYRRCDFTEN